MVLCKQLGRDPISVLSIIESNAIESKPAVKSAIDSTIKPVTIEAAAKPINGAVVTKLAEFRLNIKGLTHRAFAKLLNAPYSLVGKVLSSSRKISVGEFIIFFRQINKDPKQVLSEILNELAKGCVRS